MSSLPPRSRLLRSGASACAACAARPSACATPFGSMIMMTEPSPRMVVPENTAMCRSFDDIGLITISSVWNTPSTTMPNTWLPTCVTTTKPSSLSLSPRRRTSLRWMSGSSLLRSRRTGVSLIRSMRCSPVLLGAHQFEHGELRDGEALAARLDDQRRDDRQRQRDLDGEGGAGAGERTSGRPCRRSARYCCARHPCRRRGRKCWSPARRWKSPARR